MRKLSLDKQWESLNRQVVLPPQIIRHAERRSTLQQRLQCSRQTLRASQGWDRRGGKTCTYWRWAWEGSGKFPQRRWHFSNVLKKGCRHLATKAGRVGITGMRPNVGGGGEARPSVCVNITGKGRSLPVHVWVSVWIFKSVCKAAMTARPLRSHKKKIIPLECSGNKKPIKTPGVHHWAYKNQILLRPYLLSSGSFSSLIVFNWKKWPWVKRLWERGPHLKWAP